ncbi:MAG: O-antigen ligase family protein [Prevotella sp.]|nr:O-antigen ligase family protein [Prevotella sp.]
MLVGYELFSALISPFTLPPHQTQFFTIPFRGVCLVLSLIVLFAKGIGKPRKIKWSPATALLAAYWIILIIRLIQDFYFSPGLQIESASRNKTLLFIFGVTLPQILSVIRSYKSINYNLLFKICLWMVIVAIGINLMLNPKIFDFSYIYRIGGGSALYPIKFGYLGLTLMLLSTWLLMSKQWNKPVAWLLIIVGFFIMLRSGSRGPLVATFVLFILIFAFRFKKIWVSILIILFAAVVLALFYKEILHIIKAISPAMFQRIFDPIIQTNRNDVYSNALQTILHNPFGKHFTEYFYIDSLGLYRVFYAHNAILDAGIVGGYLGMAAMAYLYFVTLKNFHKHIQTKSEYAWLMFLIMMKFMTCLFSFAFWQFPMISIGVVLSTLLPTPEKNSP